MSDSALEAYKIEFEGQVEDDFVKEKLKKHNH